MIPLTLYAAIVADGAGRPRSTWVDCASARGLSPSQWAEARQAWEDRLIDEGPDSELGRDFLRSVYEATVATDGEPQLGLDDFVDINADVQTDVPPSTAKQRVGLDDRRWACANHAWMHRLATDPWLHVHVRLRLDRAVAERTGRAQGRTLGMVYGPANLVRTRRCPTCGALKVTVPRTAYVYCDYCATLFDYDVTVVVHHLIALDPTIVDREISSVADPLLVAAKKRGDAAEYGRVLTKLYEISCDVSPGEYSPRIKDPAYRHALIHDFLVPWVLATQFDDAHQALTKEYYVAEKAAWAAPSLASALELLAVSRRTWAHERALLEAKNILAKHPDHVDGAMFERTNVSIFVRPWLAMLDPADQTRLLEAVGLQSEYIPAPKVDFAPLGCGQCGAQLQAAEGARRVLCEMCGFILELETRSFPCQSCGARLSVPTNGGSVQCGYCNASWALG